MNDQPRCVPDQTAVLVALAAQWSREQAEVEATFPPLSEAAKVGSLRAARYAQVSFTGPIGELIAREIHDYIQGGHVLPWHFIAPRLVSLLRHREARFPLEPAHANKANPVTLCHIPGSNLRYLGPGPGWSAP